MPAYKDPKGKWYVSVYYDNWQGIRTRKLKRGFATRKEALEWERIFLMKGKGDLDMSFGAFVELYKTDLKDRLKLNGSVNHNSRKFKAENVNGDRTHLNYDYCNESIGKTERLKSSKDIMYMTR